MQKRKSVKLYWIGGYELLRDGTQMVEVKSLKQLQDELESMEMEFDNSISDMVELAKSIEEEWEYRYDDGGGRGWIEY